MSLHSGVKLIVPLFVPVLDPQDFCEFDVIELSLSIRKGSTE